MLDLICLPGLMCDESVYDDVADRLPGRVEVLRHADSDRFQDLVDHVADALPRDCLLCGHSMGAYVALAVAQRLPDRLRGLILVSASAAADSPLAAERRHKTSAWARKSGVTALADAQAQALLAPGHRNTASLTHRLRDMGEVIGLETFARHQAALAERPDQTEALAGIEIPTLILCGEEDKLTTPEAGRDMAAALPNATCHDIPNAAHMPLIEAPEEVARHIADFRAARLAEAA